MPEQRRRFSPQFRAEAVQMVIETGEPIAEVARDLGIHDGTLGNWVNAYRRAHPEPDQPLSPVERVRVKELEDEVRRLRLENEFLKKSRAFCRRRAAVAVSGGVCCVRPRPGRDGRVRPRRLAGCVDPKPSVHAWSGRRSRDSGSRRR